MIILFRYHIFTFSSLKRQKNLRRLAAENVNNTLCLLYFFLENGWREGNKPSSCLIARWKWKPKKKHDEYPVGHHEILPKSQQCRHAVLLRHLQDVQTTQFHHAQWSCTMVLSCSTTVSSYSTQSSPCSSRTSHLHHQTTLKGQDLSKWLKVIFFFFYIDKNWF